MVVPLWTTGNWTSYRNDDGAYLECEEGKGWWVYETDAEGSILVESRDADKGIVFVPPLNPEPFEKLADAQAFSVAKLPLRSGSDSRN